MRRNALVLGLLLAASPAGAQDAPGQGIPDAPATVHVRVTSTPSGASVEVLGRGEVGRTPMRRLELPVGEHDLVLTRRGYARQVVHVAVSEEGQAIAVRMLRSGRVVVRADHLEARGAAIRVDGQAADRVPRTLEVAPGRRLIEVEANGFLTFAQWVEVEPGRSSTLNVRLEARPPDVGSILITTDEPGAQVAVDGAARGRTPIHVQGLTPGEHTVVVTGAGEAREERTVEVRAGAREVLAVALLPQPEPTGSLAVSTEPAGATVVVDGEPRGQTPITVDALSPGEHRLEVSLDGYDPADRITTVVGGERADVAIALTPGTPRPGRIIATASREDAFLIVDGLSRGRVPITLEQIAPGTHAIRVVAQGATPFEMECTIRFGETCTVDAPLVAAPVAVSIRAHHGARFVDGATLRVDGEARELPFEGELPPGEHLVELSAEGYEPFSRTIALSTGDEPASLDVELTPLPIAEPEPSESMPTEIPGEQAPADGEAPTFIARDGAEPMPFESGVVRLLVGWPFLGGAEVDVGLPGPFDIGLAARTFGRVTELELHGRLGAALAEVVALGLWVRLTTDFGPDQINGFMARIDGRISLRPSPDVVVSAWGGVDLSTDDYPFSETDGSVSITPVGGVPRQNLARARIGGAAGWGFAPRWSLSLRFEGILASSSARRRILGDVAGLGNQDTELYGELGVGYRF
jgi:hypothetical protein